MSDKPTTEQRLRELLRMCLVALDGRAFRLTTEIEEALATPAPAQPAQQAGQPEVDGLLREALEAMELKQRVSLWENDTDAAGFRGTVAKLRAHLDGEKP
ncbi:MAG: hypothetical protein V4669_13975 [Pseudomonadota bacterium]